MSHSGQCQIGGVAARMPPVGGGPGDKPGGVQIEQFSVMRTHAPAAWEAKVRLPLVMSHAYLSAIEQANLNTLSRYYLSFTDGSSDLGRANVFLSDTDLSSMDSRLPQAVRAAIKSWYPRFMTFRTLECGHFTMIGEGLAVSEETADRECMLAALADKMQAIGRAEGAEIQVIRDVALHHYDTYLQSLHPRGFLPALGFSNVILPVRWEDFSGYVAALKSGTRNKVSRLPHLLDHYGISWEFTNAYASLAEEAEALWKNVHERATEYSRESLTSDFFTAFAEHLPEQSEMLLFRAAGKLVGSMLTLSDGETYTPLYWGVDYSFKHYRQARLYRAAMVLCLQRAIERGAKCLQMGPTNYEPKLSMGGQVVPLVYFVRHTSDPSLTPAIARMVNAGIGVPLCSHRPFRGPVADETDLNVLRSRIAAAQENAGTPSAIARGPGARTGSDIFAKTLAATDADVMRFAKVYRLAPEFIAAQGSASRLSDNSRVVLLGTNAYLGAATHPDVIAAARSATEHYGTGCSGSPLLNGTLDIHVELEQRLADFLGRPAVLICSTGYQTNLAAIASLCAEDDTIVLDARSHRSLFDGARMSKARCFIFRHRDMAHLEKILSRVQGRRILVVTDSLFSMEGTFAPLADICRLSKAYGARVLADESHAIGVLGDQGRGVAELQGVESDVDLVTATFSKSFASIGGFVAGPARVVDYMRHHAGAHIFSASLPAGCVATALAVLRLIVSEPERRLGVLERAAYMAEVLEGFGYEVRYSGSQIVPVVFGNAMLAVAAYKRFLERGVYVNPVGPPAVSEAEAGFRTSYTAAQQWDDLEYALDVFREHRQLLAGRAR